jgi:hypothetical protein
MSYRTVWALAALTATLTACRGDAPRQAESLAQHELDSLVAALMPSVAQATGLEFRETPRAAVRTREQVRAYVVAKFAEELPPDRLDGMMAAYRLLGMIPDTLDVGTLFVDLLTEQVAGFYEPDSATLFAVAGADGLMLRGTLAHELVHALQDQYLPLDSIMSDRDNADRLAAAQAILEGQATLVMILVLAPDGDLLGDDRIWGQLRNELTAPQVGLDVFNNAPLAIKSGLIFPYLEGASFMRWFATNHPGDQPYGDRLPQSTEQILHPDRYQAEDAPVALVFNGDTTEVMHEDTFGEYEMRVLRSALAGIEAVATDVPLGWEGDRMRVYRSPAGPALVWYSVWESEAARAHFVGRVAGGLTRLDRPGYRTVLDAVPVGELPGARVIIAPERWPGWSEIPAVTVHERR